jgi:leucyl-tRNA synthetase
MDEHYDHQNLEEKWQDKWEKEKLNSPDLDKVKNPYYNLMMFPYPSAEGLHVGNMYAFVHSDAWGRYMRLKGFDVFEPIGLDGFGIHSENYAIKQGEHILDVSRRTEKHFYEQLHLIGNQYDWTRHLETYKPEFYKWTQWIFVQMYKRGLAYQAESYVNWCPSCKTVLSDEQVISGRCERCDSLVEKKLMRQWFFKITDYAEKLLKNLEVINWSERTKTAQRNWIGKSEGAEFDMEIVGSELKVGVFTTRLDTVFGMTFALIAPEHDLVQKMKPKITNWSEVEKYIAEAKKKTEIQRIAEEREKTGVELKGIKVVNPFTKKAMAIFASDFVLAHYGTGAVMAVPGHDERDYEFAKKFGLDIIEVVKSKDGKSSIEKEAFVEDGVLINSDEYNGLTSEEAREKIAEWLKNKGIGRPKIHYKLRDWCVSRQRYWGPPIPIIYCEKDGVVPVPEKDLPVLLPETKDYIPKNDGLAPLARNEKFVKTKCPKCGGPARRETDVSDTFLDSAWYFFRYPNIEFDDKIFDKERTKKWLPVDMYIGGHEHAVLHLLYSRFMTMFFKDLGLIDFDEPYKRFFAHGLLIREGAKISKSKGNIVNPDEYIRKFGADSVRLYLMFLGDVRLGGDWRDAGMFGMHRFVKRIWKLTPKIKETKSQTENLVHKTIKKVGDDLGNLKFNTAISSLMILVNEFEKHNEIAAGDFGIFAKLISPFAPHLAEEIWSQLGHKKSIFTEKWPEFDKNLVKDETIELVVQINGKLRDKISVPADISEDEARSQALASEKVKMFLGDQEPKKVIFVKGRLINIVV